MAALWRYLQLPLTGSRIARVVRAVSVLICVSLALGSLWQAARWQNSIRRLMGMEESPGIQPVLLAVISALVFLLVLGLARLFWWVSHSFSFRLGRYVPLRTARLLAAVASVLVFWTVVNGVLLRGVLAAADRSFQALDALIDDDLTRPLGSDQTGCRRTCFDSKEITLLK